MKRSLETIAVVVCCSLPVAGAMAANKVYSENQVKGSYAFSFQGDSIAKNGFGLPEGPISAAGNIDIHWDGYDSYSPEIGTVDAHGIRAYSVAGTSYGNGFECKLTLNPDGYGKAKCLLLPILEENGAPEYVGEIFETFDFIFEENGKGFRYVGTTPGFTVLGSGRRQ